MSFSNHRLWNPICKVRFAGFVSTTLELQQCGWEIAAEQDPSHGVRLALHHRKSGLQALTNSVSPREFGQYGRTPKEFLSDVEFQVINVGTDTRFQIIPIMGAASFAPIDATPQFENSTREMRFHELIPFRTVNPDAEQIIVAPDSVPKILDLLLKCQAPAQARLRANERVRAARDIAAQIVTAVA